MTDGQGRVVRTYTGLLPDGVGMATLVWLLADWMARGGAPLLTAHSQEQQQSRVRPGRTQQLGPKPVRVMFVFVVHAA